LASKVLPKIETLMFSKLKISICICAYNEDRIIGQTLKALLEQRLAFVEISEIIVVSSACVDNTDLIVKGFEKIDQRIRLIQEKERTGKARAINLFLAECREDICCLVNADILPDVNMIEKLCLPLRDAKVGMTGARAIQVETEETFYGYASNVIRKMVHGVCLTKPRLGDVIAFRKVTMIAPNTAADEAYIEYLITKRGLSLVYVPEATMLIHGFSNMHDYLSQRVRISCAHYQLRHTTGYKVSSYNTKNKVRLVLGLYLDECVKLIWFPMIAIIEIWCMMVAAWKFYIKGHNPYMGDSEVE
jgi:biofilm PGA synthesis N-glycosyltransferase PgaC